MRQTLFAPTPPMGWNSWNTFYNQIHEDLVRSTADAMVEQWQQRLIRR